MCILLDLALFMVKSVIDLLMNIFELILKVKKKYCSDHAHGMDDGEDEVDSKEIELIAIPSDIDDPNTLLTRTTASHNLKKTAAKYSDLDYDVNFLIPSNPLSMLGDSDSMTSTHSNNEGLFYYYNVEGESRDDSNRNNNKFSNNTKKKAKSLYSWMRGLVKKQWFDFMKTLSMEDIEG
eukprot:PhF_6_TR17077/c0_g1_i1/m.26186